MCKCSFTREQTANMCTPVNSLSTHAPFIHPWHASATHSTYALRIRFAICIMQPCPHSTQASSHAAAVPTRGMPPVLLSHPPPSLRAHCVLAHVQVSSSVSTVYCELWPLCMREGDTVSNQHIVRSFVHLLIRSFIDAFIRSFIHSRYPLMHHTQPFSRREGSQRSLDLVCLAAYAREAS